MANGLLETDYTFASKQQVTVKVAFTEPTLPASPVDVAYVFAGCISGDVSINDSSAEQMTELANWCQAQGVGLVTSTEGDRDMSISFTLEVLVANASFDNLLKSRQLRNDPTWWIIERTDGIGTTKWTQAFKCRITQFDATDREDGTSQVAVTLRVNEVLEDKFA